MNSTLKVFGVLIIFFTLAILGLIIGFNTQAQTTIELSDTEQAQVEFIKSIDDNLIYSEDVMIPKFDGISKIIGYDEKIRYSYLGNEVDANLTRFDDNTSYSFVEKINTTTEKIYEQPIYYKNSNGQVQEIIYTETTPEIWSATKILTTQEKILSLLKTPYVLADDTVYADGDDSILVVDSTWSAVHDALTGTSRDSDTAYVGASHHTSYAIERSFFNFTLSTISNIDTVGLHLYVIDKTENSRTYNLYSSTASNPVVNEDFDLAGTTAYATALADTAITASAYNTWTLNSTAKTALQVGNNKISLRDVGYDVANTGPGSGTGYANLHFAVSAYTGTANDPYLLITYTSTSTPPETPTATTTDDIYPCSIPDNSRIDIITGCKNIYNGTTSSSTITGVEFFYYEIPMAIWLVFGTCFIYLFSRLRLEYLMRFRK